MSFAVGSQAPADVDHGHAALAEYLSKFELEQFTDDLVGLGASKPSDLMHVTSEDLTQMGMSSYEQARLEEHLAPILASAAAAAVVEPPKSTVKTHASWEADRQRAKGRGRGDRPIDFDQHVPGLGAAAPAADDARAADPAARPSPADVTQYPPPASPAASERSDWDESVDAAELAKLMHHGATPAVDERERERERGGARPLASAAGGRASSPPPRDAAEADDGAYAVVDLRATIAGADGEEAAETDFTDSELDDADCQADCSGDCGGLTFAALLCWDNAATSGERRSRPPPRARSLATRSSRREGRAL